MLITALPQTAARMADGIMQRFGLLTSYWSYDYGVTWRGMEALYALTGEQKYFDYIRDAMDTFVGEDGAIRDYHRAEYNLDYICNDRQLLYLFKHTDEQKYWKAAEMLRDQLRCQPRTPMAASGTSGAIPTKCGWMGCICLRPSMWNAA